MNSSGAYLKLRDELDPKHYRLLDTLRPRVKLTVETVVRRDGLLLAVTRKEDPSKLALPGGHVEVSDLENFVFFEDAMQSAAQRELFEETGLVATLSEPVYWGVDDLGNCCHAFKSRCRDFVTTPEEGLSCLWVTKAQFLSRCAFPKLYAGMSKEYALD